ncbi:MAG: hypothetical protein VB093_20430, partial [Propionicimonas sp.]|nr:hypothetical protein [Propionicimonas sp.]
GVVATTGTLLADGAGEKREVPLEEATALLDLSWVTTPAGSPTTGVEHFELYWLQRCGALDGRARFAV